MGGNQGTIFQQGEPLTNYDIVQKVPEHNISYLKHKTNNKEYMIREFAINDKTEFAQTCQKIKNRKKMESQYLTKLQRYSQQLEDNMCSSFYKIYAMWQYPTHTLADQVNERALQKRHFQQNQIFSIIASIIEGMSCLQSSGVKHECLNTGSILFDQTGTVKVADPLTSIAPSNFDRINTNRKAKGVYISPEQCESLKNQRPIPNRNPYKSDVFILGVIMLECGLLQSMDSIFVQNFEDIDLEGMNEKLDLFGKIYSKDLKLTVSTMLTRDPKQRMDWIGLKQYVPQKNDSDASRQNGTSGNSLGYKSQVISQPLPQHQSKIVLGGGVKAQNTQRQFPRQPVFANPLAKYQQQLPKYKSQLQRFQPQTHYTYGATLIHAPTQNQTFNQTVQPFVYQPPTTTINPSNFVSTTNPYGYNGLSSTLYSNPPKVSNYIMESKVNYQRPTEEFLTNNASKVNTVPQIDRQSSSFPLNQQLQFKKDYINGMQTSYNPSAYDYQSSTNQYNTSRNPFNFNPSPSNNFTSYNPLNHIPSTITTTSHAYPAIESKSLCNNEKTQIASSQGDSPFLSQHVKDAKSITYDKNLYSSYIAEDKGNSYAIHHQHQQNQQENNYSQQHHSTIVTTTNHEVNSTNAHNGYGASNYYQPINKSTVFSSATGHAQEQLQENKTVPHYVANTMPVLYQPLSTVSGTKEKPNLTNNNQTNITYANQSYKQTTNTFINNTKVPTTQQHQQTYQYKQIPYPSQQQPHQSSSSQLNQSTTQQELQYVIEHFKQGSRYQGTKYQDMRHGQGKFFYQDGGMYQGNWKFNKMDGFGKLYYQSGKIAYEGNWSQDQFQGYGKLYNEQCDQLQQPFDYENFDMIDQYWMYYEGNFVADQKDGQGKMVFSNGEYFVGNFQKDMVDGPGEFYRMNGEVVRGAWSQNQLVEFQE